MRHCFGAKQENALLAIIGIPVIDRTLGTEVSVEGGERGEVMSGQVELKGLTGRLGAKSV